LNASPATVSAMPVSSSESVPTSPAARAMPAKSVEPVAP
jgi:hypothetical protein